MTRAKATCLCCGLSCPADCTVPERVRAQLAAQRGGADAVLTTMAIAPAVRGLLAVVVLHPRDKGASTGCR